MVLVLLIHPSDANNTHNICVFLLCSVAICFLSILPNPTEVPIHLWGLNCFSFPFGAIFSIIQRNSQKELNYLKATFVNFTLFTLSFVICYFILRNPDVLILQNILKSLISLFFCSFVFCFMCSGIISRSSNRVICLLYQLLNGLGKISFEIYLIHGLWIFMLSEYFVPESVNKLLIWAIGTLIFSNAFHYIYKKMIN